MKRMLDLFSGLKGASKAFINSDEWEVITIDNNPDLNPTYCMSVEDLINSELLASWVIWAADNGEPYFDLIWASPPCIEFFKCLAPWFEEYYGEQPSMDLVKLSRYLITCLQPPTWIIENTKSGAYFMTDLLGKPRQKLGPFYLWGNFPLLNVDIPDNHKAGVDPGNKNPLRSNIRAKIPYILSQDLHDTLKYQKKLNLG